MPTAATTLPSGLAPHSAMERTTVSAGVSSASAMMATSITTASASAAVSAALSEDNSTLLRLTPRAARQAALEAEDDVDGAYVRSLLSTGPPLPPLPPSVPRASGVGRGNTTMTGKATNKRGGHSGARMAPL